MKGKTTLFKRWIAISGLLTLLAGFAMAAAPAFNSGYPDAVNPTSVGFDVLVEVNESNSTVDYVVLEDGAEKPSATNVQNGNNANGTSAIAAGNWTDVDANVEKSDTVSGLSESTPYDIYFVAEDDNGNTGSVEGVNQSTTFAPGPVKYENIDPQKVNDRTQITHDINYTAFDITDSGDSVYFYLKFPDILGGHLAPNTETAEVAFGSQAGDDISDSASIEVVDGLDSDSVQDSIRVGYQPDKVGKHVDMNLTANTDVEYPSGMESGSYNVAVQIQDPNGTVNDTQALTIELGPDEKAPSISSAETSDTNSDGDADQVRAVFNEDINDTASTLAAEAFSVSQTSINSVDTGASTNDDTVLLGIEDIPGDSTPDVSVKANQSGVSFEDIAGNVMNSNETVTASDGVAPVVEAITATPEPYTESDVGTAPEVNVSFSEDLSSEPDVEIQGLTQGTIQVNDQSFTGSKFTGTASSSINDNNEELNATIAVTNVSDGSNSVDYPGAGSLAVDTAGPNPSVSLPTKVEGEINVKGFFSNLGQSSNFYYTQGGELNTIHNVTSFDTTTLDDGETTFKVVTEDSLGNEGSANGTTYIDNTEPRIEDAYISRYNSTSNETVIEARFNERINIENSGNITVDKKNVNSASTPGQRVQVSIEGKLQTGDKPEAVFGPSSLSDRFDSTTISRKSTVVHSTRLALEPGKNFVSVPAASGSYDLGILANRVSGLEAVWTYEDGEWLSFDPDEENPDITEMEGGKGYILVKDESSAPEKVGINVYNIPSRIGDGPSAPSSEQLEGGWNLIGHFQEDSQEAYHVLTHNGLDSNVKQGDILNSKFNTVDASQNGDSFRTGKAYWMFVSGVEQSLPYGEAAFQ